MYKFINIRNAAILVGAVLLAWSVTSAFIDLENAPPPASPIDQLDEETSQVTEPAQVPLPLATSSQGTQASPTRSVLNTVTESPVLPSETPAPSSSLNQYPTEVFDFMPATQTPTQRHTKIPTQMAQVEPSATPDSKNPLIPDRIVIPDIGLDARVVPAKFRLLDVNGVEYQQWKAPNEFAAGWQTSSAPLGVVGNTVLSGHHNIYDEVFGRLVDLNIGDTLQLYSG